MGYRQWTSGQLVTAPDFQTYIQDQTVLMFASASARDAALPIPAAAGMVCYLTDIHQHQVWVNGQWLPIGGALPAARARKPGGSFSVPAGNARQPVVFTEKGFYGGVTESTGDGSLVVPAAGLYRISAAMSFGQIPAGKSAACNIGDLAAVFAYGSAGYPLANSYHNSVATTVVSLAKNAKVSLWYSTESPCNCETVELFINWIGAT